MVDGVGAELAPQGLDVARCGGRGRLHWPPDMGQWRMQEAITIPLNGGSGANWRRYWSSHQDTPRLLATEAGLDGATIDALLATETRPRCMPHDGGALIILRGVNQSPGAEPEDMVSVRLWIDAARVVSVQFRPLLALDDLALSVGAGTGPKTAGDFIVVLAELLAEHMQSTIETVDAELDGLEDHLGKGPAPKLRTDITALRRKVVTLRRFIAPQRDALGLLFAEEFEWQTKVQDRRLRNTIDRITRLVEQLDEINSRAAIFQESLTGFVTERLNRTMALLSVVAGVFLPLSFVASLMGMNVGGIPGSGSVNAFAVIVGAMIVTGVAEVVLFRWLKLM